MMGAPPGRASVCARRPGHETATELRREVLAPDAQREPVSSRCSRKPAVARYRNARGGAVHCIAGRLGSATCPTSAGGAPPAWCAEFAMGLTIRSCASAPRRGSSASRYADAVTSLVIVDDHEALREGLGAWLREHGI